MAGGTRTRAKAIVAKRFDCNEIGDSMPEIAAYRTVVTVESLDPLLPEQA